MSHFIKRFWAALALIVVAGAQSVWGYAMLGPYESYQVPTIGYHLTPPSTDFGNLGGGSDSGAPKNFGQGYRWNTPTNYYACTEAFERYFGSSGVAAVDSAFAMFNNLTNVTDLNLSDWPTYNATSINYRAQALQLYDLKSMTMSLIIEQLGLGQPDRWAWCLNSRYTYSTCPNYEYLVIQRNFDPVTGYYSQYVNDVLYDFEVYELCGVNPNVYAPLEADAVEVLVDPTQAADSVGSVAANATAYNFGSFFLSFTRDDIGGLKALYSSTNAYAEQALTNAVEIITNKTQQLLVTSNLSLFYQAALTNDDVALSALYPGLIILTNLTTNAWTLVVTTNITPTVKVPPGAPAGTLELVLQTNYVTNVLTLYYHTFANFYIVHSYPQSRVGQQIVSTAPVLKAPAGTVKTVTNVTYTTIQGMTNGDFYILPTNLCGPYTIVSNIFVNVTAVTNFLQISNNIPAGFVTNQNTTNFNTYATINFYTNYYLAVEPVQCVTNTSAVRGGMEKFTFVRQEYDPILNQLVTPITNIYHLTAISNGSPVVQTFRRVLTQPDILIDSSDFFDVSGPTLNADSPVWRTFMNFNTNLVPAQNGGPGTIQSTGIQFIYNSVGPLYYNVLPFFTLPGGVNEFGQTNALRSFQWGSFDATTNAPIVYPDGASISNMEAQLYYQITTSTLPDASVSANGPGNSYTYTLQAAGPGLVSPFAWSLTVASGGLPPGLTLTSDGTISGSPTATGVYDFTVQMTDAVGHIAQKDLFIVVDP